jgi:hypothetical protein
MARVREEISSTPNCGSYTDAMDPVPFAVGSLWMRDSWMLFSFNLKKSEIALQAQRRRY